MGTDRIRVFILMVSVVAMVTGASAVKAEGSGGNEYPIPTNFVSGLVNSLRRIDLWNQKNDNPWFRGGKSVSIIGNDGVRYYVAHLEKIINSLNVGSVVQVGQRIGTVGKTGRAGACHVHFGISPPCANPEWWVRRGVIWPASYFKVWRSGGEKSPALEVQQWLLNNPDVCLEKSRLPWPAN